MPAYKVNEVENRFPLDGLNTKTKHY